MYCIFLNSAKESNYNIYLGITLPTKFEEVSNNDLIRYYANGKPQMLNIIFSERYITGHLLNTMHPLKHKNNSI